MNDRILTPTARAAYAEAMLAAVRTVQVRFPGRVPGETVATLVEDLVGEGTDPRDVRTGVAMLAREAPHYDEAGLRAQIAAARTRREMLEPPPARLQLVARGELTPTQERAGGLTARIIARAIARDASAFARARPEALTRRQQQLREALAAAIEGDPSVTDAELLARFGGGEAPAGLSRVGGA